MPPGLDLSRVLESWQEAVFRLALSGMEEEAERGRLSCAGFGGLGVPLRGVPNPEHTQSCRFYSAEKCWLSGEHQMWLLKNARKEHETSTHRIPCGMGLGSSGRLRPEVISATLLVEKPAPGSAHCLPELDLEG